MSLIRAPCEAPAHRYTEGMQKKWTVAFKDLPAVSLHV